MHPTDPELHRFLDESLAEDDNARVDSHVAHCERCQTRVERLIDSTFAAPGKSTTRKLAGEDHATVGPDDTQSPHGAPRDSDLATARANIDHRFVIVDEIDRGGMGVVYRGFDRELKREVAIKIAHTAVGGVDELRFRREAQISAQLQHPGIIPVHQTGQLRDGRQYIAMKLIDGQTLLQVIGKYNEPPTSRLLAVFNDICQTMAYAHSRNVIHRDLKPDNVMVGTFGEVQVMDWGLASRLKRTPAVSDEVENGSPASETNTSAPGETQLGSVFGTPAYMAPEQARGDIADKRTDVFSLGGILYQILTGKPPFEGPTASAAMQQSLENDLKSAFERLDNSGADEELITLVKSCLATTPDDRPHDAQAVSFRFADYLAGRERQFEETRLEKARADERLIAQQKRTRTLLQASVIVLATVVASGVAGYMYLVEKNARLASQAKADREALELKVRHEGESRSSITAAQVHAEAASKRARAEQHLDWTLALKEIQKATPLVSDAIEPQLVAEFHKLQETVRDGRLAALTHKEHHDQEAACVAGLSTLVEQTYYPEDMRLCSDLEPMPKVRGTF